MQIAFQAMSAQRPSTPAAAKPASTKAAPDLDTVLDKIDIEGDRVVSDLHLKNAWQGAGVGLAGATIGLSGAALALTSSSSMPGLIAGGVLAGVGTAISLAGIYLSDTAFIAANRS